MSKLKYCAVGEEGIEYASDTHSETQEWIDEMVSDNDIADDYYYIGTYTQAELDAMPEV